ncbi:MAG: P1 family peptidase [Solirubrobacterales bacterium]
MAKRWRDIAGAVGRLEPGPRNAITDVPGVRVGHSQAASGEATGVTVVEPPELPAYAGVRSVNGTGVLTASLEIEEWGLMDTPAYLCGTHAVGVVYDAAVHASGRGPERVTIPVVGECDDGDMADSRTVVAGDVEAALATLGDEVGEGTVGAGTGMSCFDFPGGIGTASRRVGANLEHTVGVLLLCNFGDREYLDVLGTSLGPAADPREAQGSCIAICATDAPLSVHQLGRLALRPFSGSRARAPAPPTAPGEISLAFAPAGRAGLEHGAIPAILRRGVGGGARGGAQLPGGGPAGRRLDILVQDASTSRSSGCGAGGSEGRAGGAPMSVCDGADLEEVVELTRELASGSTPPTRPVGRRRRPCPPARLRRRRSRGCELAGPDPDRLNLIARVPRGSGAGPSLMLMGHTVVPAGGELDRAAVRGRDRGRPDHPGRGVSDMKGLAAHCGRRGAIGARRPGQRETSCSSPSPTRSATPPTPGCRGSSASARTCAAITR